MPFDVVNSLSISEFIGDMSDSYCRASESLSEAAAAAVMKMQRDRKTDYS